MTNRKWLVYCKACGEADVRLTRKQARLTKRLYEAGHGPSNVLLRRLD